MARSEDAEPLTGNAAYQAQKQEIAKRNDAARARGRAARAERDDAAIARRVDQEKAERKNTPKQPGRKK